MMFLKQFKLCEAPLKLIQMTSKIHIYFLISWIEFLKNFLNFVSLLSYYLLSLILLFIFCSHSWECLADAYFARGAYTCALRSYQRAFQLDPETFYPLIQLANIKLVSISLFLFVLTGK